MKMYLNNFFGKLCMLNGFLCAVLIVFLKVLTGEPTGGKLILSAIFSIFLIIGSTVFKRSNEVPSLLVFMGKVATAFIFCFFIFSYISVYQEWRNGVYN